MKHTDSEEKFLNQIAHQLGRSRLTTPPRQPVRGVPSFWQRYQLSPDERVELFMKNWEALGGVAKRFATRHALGAYIVEVVRKLEARRVIREDHPLLTSTHLDGALADRELTVWNELTAKASLLKKAAGAEIGLAVADFAIAHTGTVVMTSGANKGRSLSLLPAVFIAVVPTAKVKTRMGEVLKEINEWHNRSMPAGVHFVSGPSRSADIENDLTIGVHGPGIVYALLLDEERET